MRHFCFKSLLCALFFSVFILKSFSQNATPLWSKSSENQIYVSKNSNSSKALVFNLDLTKMKSILKEASNTSSKTSSHIVIEIPNTEGGLDKFKITESSILEPDFQKTHPEIRTYVGNNINNPSSTISFSMTPKGFHGVILSSKTDTQLIDPYLDKNTYKIYNKKDLPLLKNEFKCLVEDEPILKSKTSTSSKALINPNDSKLRTFRIAIASTIEYSEYHWTDAGLNAGDSELDKKNAVLAAMVVTMNRINTIFQRDLSVKMIMVDNTDIIFINSDNLDNDNNTNLIVDSQNIINNTIGSANYDIGHTFSTGPGGLASVRVPCVNNSKARGVTGLTNPIGETYHLIVCHEIGHQFGSRHTFNGDAGSCLDNRTVDFAYEPGSGSTIMAYPGKCSPQSVQGSKDAYFHQKSISAIWDNITTGNSTCGQETTITNNAPIADAGADHTIPISTPFKLTGNSSDPDGTSTHTYTWEQYDLGPAGPPLETNTQGPIVRSLEGTNNPVRYIPLFSDYVATNSSGAWEKLPSVNRTMTFALTVRDNDVIGTNGGGQTDADFMTITINSTEPFTVVNPFSWAQGATEIIEWNVGQTANASTINCQSVNIKLSTDGGVTFPVTIATGVPNNGSYSYTVPSIPDTNQARFLVEAADNIFYDVSDSNFTISTEPEFFIDDFVLTPVVCDDTSATYTFDYLVTNGFSESTTFSASNLPGSATATFSPSSLNSLGSVTMTINNLNGVTANNYNIIITGTSSSLTKNESIDFPFTNAICTSQGNNTYATSTTFVEFNTINQTSAKTSGYSDYRSISTNVVTNIAYDLNVRANTDGDWTTFTKAWIDWNQNCSFDEGEDYNLGSASNVSNGLTSNSPLSITVPDSAVPGSTVMRVSTRYGGSATSCENDFDGEVEDYTINISTGASDFFMNNIILSNIDCSGSTATYTFDYLTANGFSETTTFSASALPGSSTATFSPTSLNSSGNVTMTINNLDGVAQNNYTFTLTGNATTINRNETINFTFFSPTCVSSGNTKYPTSTTSVLFNTINQTSGKTSGYSNYAGTPTNVTKNETYDLSIKVNTDGYVTKTKVWIDWNQNCSFNDAGEEYNLGTAMGVTNDLTSNSPLAITVPNNAATGKIAMRVSTKYYVSENSPCENDFDGEVEDYALNISSTLSTKDIQYNTLSIYPNPNKGRFTIALKTPKSELIKTEVFDISGRVIFKSAEQATPNYKKEIHLNNVKPGLYLLTVRDGVDYFTNKIVIR